MLRALLPRLRARRLVPTTLAVLLAVAFVAGVMIFGDTARAALVDDYARSARAVDVAVTAGPDRRLPLSTVDAVRAVAGVRAAAGRMREPLPLLDPRGRLAAGAGAPAHGIDVGEVPALRGYDPTAGRLPAAAGEAALDRDTATATGYRIGAEITVLDGADAPHRLRLVGLVDLRAAPDSTAAHDGSPVTVLTGPDLVRLTGASGYREVVAALRPGVDAAGVRARLPVPEGATARTGAQLRSDLARRAFSRIELALLALHLFGWVAVLVAVIVGYNTFAVLVAQRMREIALLRCIGAGRGQVLRLLLAEAGAVGLAGVLPGLALGVAVGYGLQRGTALVGGDLPDHALVVTARPVLVAVLLGMAVPVLAAAGPALRAARVPPVAALRADPPGGPGGRRARWARYGLAAGTAVAGVVLTAAALRATAAEPALALVVAGGAAHFATLLLVLPLLVGPVTAGLARLPARLLGVPVRLAAANIRRHPGRTAVTMAALLVGVTLMAGGSTVAATVDRTGEAQLNRAFPVDFLVTPAGAGRAAAPVVPPAAVAGLRAEPAFDLVAAVRLGTASTPAPQPGRARVEVLVGTIEAAAVGTAFRPEVTAGSLAGLRPGGAVVSAASDALRGRGVGDRLPLTTPDGRVVEVTVAAVARSASLVGDVLVAGDDFGSLFPAVGESLVLVRAGAGVTAATARQRLDAALTGYPLVQVSDLAEVRDERNAAVDTLLTLVAVLLAVSLLISLVGIANTLALSVLERTRESALVRALGLTGRQVAAVFVVEALLTATCGALIGVGFGVGYGWVLTEAVLGGLEPRLEVPWAQLAGYVVVAAVAGVLAALLPARRAARTPPAAALGG